MKVFITVDDNDAVYRGPNVNDSIKLSYLWIPTIFGHIYNSVGSADEESRLVLLK